MYLKDKQYPCRYTHYLLLLLYNVYIYECAYTIKHSGALYWVPHQIIHAVRAT